MNNKALNIFYILCLVLAVGIMSWRDMHPKVNAALAAPGLGVTSYYVGAHITPAMIPDDSKPLTIGLGGFITTPDGKTIWKQGHWLPTTFAQRQINLQFHFEGLPRDPAETVSKIKSITEDWVHKGDTVNVLILDYSPDQNPDFKAYAAFLKAAHDAFKRTYVLYTLVDTSWVEGPQKESLKELQDSSPVFLIRLTQSQMSPAFLSRLEAFNYNFVLQFPVGVRWEDLDMAALKKLTSLNGITLTLDPRQTLLKPEEKIGVLPKL
jgi:hypothetical protein